MTNVGLSALSSKSFSPSAMPGDNTASPSPTPLSQDSTAEARDNALSPPGVPGARDSTVSRASPLETPGDFLPPSPACVLRCPDIPTVAKLAYGVLRKWQMIALRHGQEAFPLSYKALGKEMNKSGETARRACRYLRGKRLNRYHPDGSLVPDTRPDLPVLLACAHISGKRNMARLLRLPDEVLAHATDGSNAPNPSGRPRSKLTTHTGSPTPPQNSSTVQGGGLVPRGDPSDSRPPVPCRNEEGAREGETEMPTPDAETDPPARDTDAHPGTEPEPSGDSRDTHPATVDAKIGEKILDTEDGKACVAALEAIGFALNCPEHPNRQARNRQALRDRLALLEVELTGHAAYVLRFAAEEIAERSKLSDEDKAKSAGAMVHKGAIYDDVVDRAMAAMEAEEAGYYTPAEGPVDRTASPPQETWEDFQARCANLALIHDLPEPMPPRLREDRPRTPEEQARWDEMRSELFGLAPERSGTPAERKRRKELREAKRQRGRHYPPDLRSIP